MMHRDRRWSLSAVRSAEELARMLTRHTWTLCSAFAVAGHEEYLFLNDATHEDGAGEYAALKRLPDGTYVQVESVTFSWCEETKATTIVRQILAGEYDAADYARPVCPKIQAPEQHGRCHFCA